MKWLNKRIVILFLFIGLFLIGIHFGLYIPCPILKTTGFYCPGCGITRMFLSLFKLQFYQAFRYNPLLFILLPFLLPLLLYELYIFVYKKEKIFIKRIPNSVWIALTVILIVYGILRNIEPFTILAPTKIV